MYLLIYTVFSRNALMVFLHSKEGNKHRTDTLYKLMKGPAVQRTLFMWARTQTLHYCF